MVTANCPNEAFDAAPNRTETLCPALTEKGEAGLAVTPGGSPVNETCTAAEKPFSAVTVTLTGALVPPCGTVLDAVENRRTKSACGGGDCFPPPPSPPQATVESTKPKARIWALRTPLRMARLRFQEKTVLCTRTGGRARVGTLSLDDNSRHLSYTIMTCEVIK